MLDIYIHLCVIFKGQSCSDGWKKKKNLSWEFLWPMNWYHRKKSINDVLEFFKSESSHKMYKERKKWRHFICNNCQVTETIKTVVNEIDKHDTVVYLSHKIRLILLIPYVNR